MSRQYYSLGKLAETNQQRTAVALSPPILPVRSEELRAAYERIQQLESMLGECREYFEDCSDVIDGSNGVPAPNREMQILIQIDEVLS